MVILAALQFSLSVANAIWYSRLYYKSPSMLTLLLLIVPLFFVLLSIIEIAVFVGYRVGVATYSIFAGSLLGLGLLCSIIQFSYMLKAIIKHDK